MSASRDPRDCDDDIVVVPKRNHDEGIWHKLLLRLTPAVCHILLCAVGIHFFQQSSGIDSVVLYHLEIFKKTGIYNDRDKLLATMTVDLVKTLFILVIAQLPNTARKLKSKSIDFTNLQSYSGNFLLYNVTKQEQEIG
ncbi:polyol/monosaccharide transporter 5 [Perilla frutescens var. frutescens]|nr:polyol/monosaccharide transporter 5 [Perilla frutescens var. frutescens]